MAGELAWARFLVEVRSSAPDWEAEFVAEAMRYGSYELDDGLLLMRHGSGSRPHRDALGLGALCDAAMVAAAFPGAAWLDDGSGAEACPFVGPRRGFFAFAIDAHRGREARRFGVAAARAGRGVVVDLGPTERRRLTPRVYPTVTRARVDIRADAWTYDLDKRHHEIVLFEDHAAYRHHLDVELGKVEGRARGGVGWIDIWQYTPDFWGDASDIFD